MNFDSCLTPIPEFVNGLRNVLAAQDLSSYQVKQCMQMGNGSTLSEEDSSHAGFEPVTLSSRLSALPLSHGQTPRTTSGDGHKGQSTEEHSHVKIA